MDIKLISTEHGNYDFEVIGAAPITRVKIPETIQYGDLFNMYYGESSKSAVKWEGKNGIEGYLIGDVQRSIVQSEIWQAHFPTNKYIKPSSHKPITTLVLGKNRNPHVITKKDRFLDNGVCIQLIKEVPMKVQYEGDSLVLDDNAIGELKRYQQLVHSDHEYKRHHPNASCSVFSIVSDEERFLVLAYESQAEVDARKGTFLGGEGRYNNALEIKDRNISKYHTIKIFDTDKEEINY